MKGPEGIAISEVTTLEEIVSICEPSNIYGLNATHSTDLSYLPFRRGVVGNSSSIRSRCSGVLRSTGPVEDMGYDMIGESNVVAEEE